MKIKASDLQPGQRVNRPVKGKRGVWPDGHVIHTVTDVRPESWTDVHDRGGHSPFMFVRFAETHSIARISIHTNVELIN